MYFPIINRISGFFSYHDFSDITEYNHKIKIMGGDQWEFCDIRMPHYDYLHIGKETHKFLNEKDPVYYAKRIKDTQSTAYLDYKAQDGGYWLDFIAYGDKSQRGSGRAGKLLKMALESVFAGFAVNGTVPMLNTASGHYQKLLRWYQRLGFEVTGTIEGEHPQACIQRLAQDNPRSLGPTTN